jgi:hypothetical protein
LTRRDGELDAKLRGGKPWKSSTHREQHVGHVLLDGLVIDDPVFKLGDTHTLSGQHCLIDAERAAGEAENATIRWDAVADVNSDDIARNELGSVDLVRSTGADDVSLVGRVFLESLWMNEIDVQTAIKRTWRPMLSTHIDCTFSLGLLDDTDGRVGNQDQQDDQRLDERRCPASTWLGNILKASQDEGYDGRSEEDQHELVLKLSDDELDERRRWVFREDCEAMICDEHLVKVKGHASHADPPFLP